MNNTQILDSLFSQFIRLREADEYGMVECITCGERMPWQLAQAAHFNSRRHLASRWMVINVHSSCNRCNVEMNGNLEVYRERLVELYGEETVLGLEKLKSEDVKFSKVDINQMITEYRKLVNELKSVL